MSSYWQGGFWFVSVLLVLTLMFLVYKMYGKNIRQWSDSGLSISSHIQSKKGVPKNEKGIFLKKSTAARKDYDDKVFTPPRNAQSVPMAQAVPIAQAVPASTPQRRNGFLGSLF
jgi:hypothetical protein